MQRSLLLKWQSIRVIYVFLPINVIQLKESKWEKKETKTPQIINRWIPKSHLLLYLFRIFRYFWGSEITLKVYPVPPVPDYSRRHSRNFASWSRNHISILGYPWRNQCRNWSPELVGLVRCNVIEPGFYRFTFGKNFFKRSFRSKSHLILLSISNSSFNARISSFP